jgi:hypothetical protein
VAAQDQAISTNYFKRNILKEEIESRCSTFKILGIETTENMYSHIPKPVCQHKDITVLWNQGVQTDREVLANRPDIIIKK